MQKNKVTSTIIFLILLCAVVGISPQTPIQEEEPGERLTRTMWKAIQASDIDAIVTMLADGYQSVHEDGSRDKTGEIELFKGINMGDYTLNDFNVTRVGPSLIVTYSVTVEETIAGQRASTTPAPRMSVWQMTEGGWKLIAHANLNPIKR